MYSVTRYSHDAPGLRHLDIGSIGLVNHLAVNDHLALHSRTVSRIGSDGPVDSGARDWRSGNGGTPGTDGVHGLERGRGSRFGELGEDDTAGRGGILLGDRSVHGPLAGLFLSLSRDSDQRCEEGKQERGVRHFVGQVWVFRWVSGSD